MALMQVFSAAKDAVSEALLGKTKALREKYAGSYCNTAPWKERTDVFERCLDTASTYRSVREFNNWGFLWLENGAVARRLALKKSLSGKTDAKSRAARLWTNMEAYKELGETDYIGSMKEDADALVHMVSDPYQFVASNRESRAENHLLAASALLQFYELLHRHLKLPIGAKYRETAETLLDLFKERHVDSDNNGEIADALKIDVLDGKATRIRYDDTGKRNPQLKKLAAIAYMNAYRVTGKYETEARQFFEASDKSLLMCSEAANAFRTREQSDKYLKLLKSELEDPKFSAENFAGVINKPVFDATPTKPAVLKKLIDQNEVLDEYAHPAVKQIVAASPHHAQVIGPQITFGEMTEEDAAGVIGLISRAMNEDEGRWAEKTIDFHYTCLGNGKDDGRAYYVAKLENGQVAGISGLHHYEWGPDDVVWLGWFAVEPDLQRNGIGNTMMEKACALAKEKGYRKLLVETYSNLPKGVNFYEKFGFKKAGNVKDYVSEGVDMIVYAKDLK